MQLRHSIIALFLLASSICGLCGDQDLANHVVEEIQHDEVVDFTLLNPDLRLKVIQHLKLDLQRDLVGSTRHYIIHGLIVLDDDETIKAAVRQYHATSNFSDLENFGRESVIALVAPDLSLPSEQGRKNVGDVIISATRVTSAMIILSCLKRSTKFPPDTVQWAKHLTVDVQDTWSVFLPWWEKNKAAIFAERYQDATWLPPQPKVSAKPESATEPH
jgi:hypothetical protein